MEEFDEIVEEALLVWVQTLRGVTPQKWTQIDYSLPFWKRRVVFAYRRISDIEMKMTLDELMVLYPPEKCVIGYPDRRKEEA
jgi:hypothetical protein